MSWTAFRRSGSRSHSASQVFGASCSRRSAVAAAPSPGKEIRIFRLIVEFLPDPRTIVLLRDQTSRLRPARAVPCRRRHAISVERTTSASPAGRGGARHVALVGRFPPVAVIRHDGHRRTGGIDHASPRRIGPWDHTHNGRDRTFGRTASQRTERRRGDGSWYPARARDRTADGSAAGGGEGAVRAARDERLRDRNQRRIRPRARGCGTDRPCDGGLAFSGDDVLYDHGAAGHAMVVRAPGGGDPGRVANALLAVAKFGGGTAADRDLLAPVGAVLRS